MVARVVMISVASAAVAACAVAGCSNSGSSTSASSSTSGATSAAAGGTAVIVDGQKQNISGTVTCTAAGANTNVALGDASAGVGVVVSNDSPPVVQSVGLGTVNGVMLGYAAGGNGQGSASATKTGNSYKVTGNAVGFATSSQQQVTKSFELDFTCP